MGHGGIRGNVTARLRESVLKKMPILELRSAKKFRANFIENEGCEDLIFVTCGGSF